MMKVISHAAIFAGNLAHKFSAILSAFFFFFFFFFTKYRYVFKIQRDAGHLLKIGTAPPKGERSGRVGLSVGQGTGCSWVRILLRQLRFGTLVFPFPPLYHCLWEEKIKAVGPFLVLSDVYARGSKRLHQSALEMCALSWTPSLLEKDNSKHNHVYNRVYSSMSVS